MPQCDMHLSTLEYKLSCALAVPYSHTYQITQEIRPATKKQIITGNMTPKHPGLGHVIKRFLLCLLDRNSKTIQ
jgi:hypothetical protein